MKGELIKQNLRSAKNYAYVAKERLFGRSKGQFAATRAMVPLALSIVIVSVVVGVGALVLNEMDNTTTDADTSNVLTTGVAALTDFADFFSIIVVVGIAAIIFLLLRVLRSSGNSASA